MDKKWKLVHKEDMLMIENQKGKTLRYNPNSGIGILEQDGYAFKDINGSGTLEAFEDWRKGMKERVSDFMKQYGLKQRDGVLYYKRGFLRIPQDMVQDINIDAFTYDMLSVQMEAHLDEAYLKDHYLFVVLLLMFDCDDGSRLQDYTILTFIQGIEHGFLDHLMYSIAKGMKQFLSFHAQRTLHGFT